MSAAQYNRGSRALSACIDRDIPLEAAYRRNERQAAKDERARLLARVADLESRLHRSERARSILRVTLSEERAARVAEQEQQESTYRFAVRVLGQRAGLEGS